jgi:nucleoside-diphosphate-sugar epimerase
VRALVTGATGFLGSHLARQLAARGDDVRVLVRATSDRSRLDGVAAEVAEGDVTDRASVESAVRGCDWVFHCAATVEFGARDPLPMERVNVDGTRHVLEAARDAGASALHVSSVSACGPTPPGEPPKDEWWWDHQPRAVLYEDTKRRAHELARAMAVDGASVRIAMPGGIYGFGDTSTMAQLIAAYGRWPIPVGYLPDVRQSMVNVDDCADALLRIADAGRDGDEFVVVAQTTTIAEWLDIIVRAGGHREPRWYLSTERLRSLAGPGATVASWFGQSPAMVRETIAVATHDASYTGDKLRRELGWKPRSLEQGMQEMVDAIKAEAAAAKADRRSRPARTTRP